MKQIHSVSWSIIRNLISSSIIEPLHRRCNLINVANKIEKINMFIVERAHRRDSIESQPCLDIIHCIVLQELCLDVQRIEERFSKQQGPSNDHHDDSDDDVDFEALCHDELTALIGRITEQTRSRSSRKFSESSDCSLNHEPDTKESLNRCTTWSL